MPRDPLPLPVLAARSLPRGVRLSRRAHQRLAKSVAVDSEVGRTIEALNDLYCGSPASRVNDVPVTLSAVQCGCLEHLRASVAALGPAPDGLSPAEALRELRIAGQYDVDSSSLVAYDRSLVSLPPEGSAACALAQLWGEGGHEAVVGFVDNKLLPSEKAEVRLREAEVTKTYSDPAFRHPRTWELFVRDLRARGLVDFALHAVE